MVGDSRSTSFDAGARINGLTESSVVCLAFRSSQVPILRDLPHALRVKLACDTHMNLMRKLSFFEGLDVAVITEVVYRLKPMQMKRKVSFKPASQQVTLELPPPMSRSRSFRRSRTGEGDNGGMELGDCAWRVLPEYLNAPINSKGRSIVRRCTRRSGLSCI